MWLYRVETKEAHIVALCNVLQVNQLVVYMYTVYPVYPLKIQPKQGKMG